MNIVIVDGYTLNPGDLSWDGFRQLGSVTLYDRTPAEQTIERTKDADVILTNKVILDEKILNQLPKLKYIGIFATGYNVVDLKAARARNIPVTNIPTYGTDSVAQSVFAHVLNIACDIAEGTGAVRAGEWGKCTDFCFWKNPLIELVHKTFGIVGFGLIGRRVAKIAQAFGMKVLAFEPRLNVGQIVDGVEIVEMDTLLAQSDVISLHCPLTDSNRQLINAERLAKMKQGAILINTARGPLLDEQAVADALKSGHLRGVGTDVLSVEPPKADNPLLSAPRCYSTPHSAWGTHEARARLMDIAVANLQAFLDGKPQNVVN